MYIFLRKYPLLILLTMIFNVSCSGDLLDEVLNEGYDGSTNDSSLDTEVSTIEEDGAKSFARCETAIECSFLMDAAREWINKHSYVTKLMVDNDTTIETQKKKHHGFIINKVKLDESNFEIQIKGSCLKGCLHDIDLDLYAFNNYLKQMLALYKKGEIEYSETTTADFEEIKTANSALDIDLSNDDVSSKGLDIEIIDSPKTRYLRSIEKQLVGEYNCNKESEVVLLKRIDNRELYEINCIREIKRMIFDCSPNGCEVLQ
jgi:hypothetical protein